MSTEEPQQEAPPATDVDAPMQDSPTATAPATAGTRRPRLNLNALGIGGGERGERKRGKSMFGVLVNTLNKAKAEDKERNASEAAKKRQLIEQRLQSKLKKDADSVRQVEEAKKDKVTASRKEEDLQLRDSIHKLRRTRLPLLANFLLTSDVILSADADMDNDFQLSSLLPTRSHPPPLYYLPAILTPEQDAFLSKRKAQAREAAEKEWEQFKVDRAAGVEEITALRQKVAAVRNGQSKSGEEENGDGDHAPSSAVEETPIATNTSTNGIGAAVDRSEGAGSKDAEMEIDENDKDEGPRESRVEVEGEVEGEVEKEKERPTAPPPAADEDDAVEY